MGVTAKEGGGPFHCSICLELVCKPVVLNCGHVFCFWCTHAAMDNRKQSQCAVCRAPYIHFPRVCNFLHFLLMKAAPEEYKRRTQEIEEIEKANNVFSPQVSGPHNSIRSPCLGQQLPASSSRLLDVSQHKQSDVIPRLLLGHSSESNVSENVNRISNMSQKEISASDGDFRDSSSLHMECAQETNGHIAMGRGHKLYDVEDFSSRVAEEFQCASCSKFLYRPAVLNCGQVFCESCVNKRDTVVHCSTCQRCHQGVSVHVCLELHHYLESMFPEEYLSRRREVLQAAAECRTAEKSEEEGLAKHGMEGHCIHVGVGCDQCGMFPIVGERYHCVDCSEIVGYDLCGNCYRNEKIHFCGRFNQQHRPDHCMEKLGFVLTGGETGLVQHHRHLTQRQMLEDLDDYIDSLV